VRPKGPEFRTWSRILSKWQNGPQKVRILFERSEFCLLYKLKGPMVLNQDSGSVTLQTSRLNVRPFVRCPRCPPPPFLTRAHNYSPMTQPKHKQANQYTNYLVKKTRVGRDTVPGWDFNLGWSPPEEINQKDWNWATEL